MSTAITATVTYHGQVLDDLPVINPGGWFGKVWLIGSACGYSVIYAVVEADGACDAIDEAVEDDDFGKAFRIDVEVEGGDYGFEVNPGDIIGGADPITEKGWLDLKGTFYPHEEGERRYLSEPHTSGQGVLADLEYLSIAGGDDPPLDCTYYGADLPEDGVSPWSYAHVCRCDNCGEDFYPADKAHTTFCSPACEDAWHAEETDDDA